MIRKYNRRQKQTNAKKVGTFKSGLEKYMSEVLKKNGIKFSYEKRKFVLIESFTSENVSYEKFMNGKGDFKDRGNKSISNMKYTPDFTNPEKEVLKWVIETKGRAMPDFSRTWKLFKRRLKIDKMDNVILFVPRTKKDCDKVVELIKNKYNE